MSRDQLWILFGVLAVCAIGAIAALAGFIYDRRHPPVEEPAEEVKPQVVRPRIRSVLIVPKGTKADSLPKIPKTTRAPRRG